MSATGSKLVIIPAISAGNIPQLAVDLLIHTLGAQRVGVLDDKYLYPFAGARDYVDKDIKSSDSCTGITRAAEIYEKDNITLVQLRSPPIPGMQWQFVQNTLFPYLNAQGFTDIIIATSSNAGLVEQHLIPADRLKLYSNSEILCHRLASLSVSPPGTQQFPLAESGYTKDILRHAHELSADNVSALVMFSYEGDNFEDARTMASELVKAAGLTVPSVWITPKSWQGVYGRTIPSGLEQGLYS